MIKIEDIPVPYIGGKYKPIEILPMSFLQTEYALGHRRLMVFAKKGVHCVNPDCNKVGIHLIKAIDSGGNEHIDLYTENFEMMTVDHIIPRAEKGSDELINKNPMCQTCNTDKGKRIELKYITKDMTVCDAVLALAQ